MFIAEAPTSGQAPTDAANAADAVRATARADGVGPRLDANPGRERAVYALPGALCNLPTDVARAGAEQQALPKRSDRRRRRGRRTGYTRPRAGPGVQQV